MKITESKDKAEMIRSVKHFLMQYAIYLVLVAIIVTIVILEPSILSVRNATFILQQAAPKLIIALGLAGLILLGGTDLSAGRMVGIAGVICASLLQKPDYALRIFKTMAPLPIIVPLLIAIAVCVFFAIMHSTLISIFQIAPFIASLGMQMIVYGVMSLYFDGVNNSSPIGGFDTRFTKIAQGSIQMGSFRLPWIVIYALVITFFFWVLWYRTTLGRNMYAVGGNKEAAIVSGVNTKRVIILVYILAGVAYALAGFLDAGRTGSATNGLGEGYELDAIASCVVGGVSLRGGVGRISGVVTGVLIFQVLSYCLVYMDINPYIQFIIKGMIIIFATVVDTQKYIKKR